MIHSFLRKAILLTLITALILPFASAAPKTSPDFYPQFNNGTDLVHYNQTQTYHDEPLIPKEVTWILLGLGLMFLILSRFASPEQGNDFFALLAIPPLFVSTWTSLQMDWVYSGVTSQQYYMEQNYYNVWVMMTEHNVFHMEFLFGVLLIFAVLSVVNFIQIMLKNAGREVSFRNQEEEQE